MCSSLLQSIINRAFKDSQILVPYAVPDYQDSLNLIACLVVSS